MASRRGQRALEFALERLERVSPAAKEGGGGDGGNQQEQAHGEAALLLAMASALGCRCAVSDLRLRSEDLVMPILGGSTEWRALEVVVADLS